MRRGEERKHVSRDRWLKCVLCRSLFCVVPVLVALASRLDSESDLKGEKGNKRAKIPNLRATLLTSLQYYLRYSLYTAFSESDFLKSASLC